ncbi:hypothetical protein QBC37DRAFT_450559 [Rhypophila decipiens]|uniref:Mitochondrial division protein 1 n=1 Tax=Rhypophila decipiens TaxID=261697 RepID=A0AAN7B1L1_9PEZI|nr:hypothetical protein QBC37DRAFT_450559 [Rhypophila decipiens]
MSSGPKPLPELVRDSELETKFDSGRRTIHFFHDTPTTTRQEVWQREKKPIGRGAFGEVWLEKPEEDEVYEQIIEHHDQTISTFFLEDPHNIYETGTCDIAETSVGKKTLTLRPSGSGGNTNRLSPDQLRVSKFSLASILDSGKDDVPGDFTYIAGAFLSESPNTLAALWDNGDGFGGVHVWDVEKGVITRMFAHKLRRKEKKTRHTRQTGADASGSRSSQLDRSCIVFSPDSQMIAYSYRLSSTIRVANLTAGDVTELGGHELPITMLAFSAPQENTSNDCTVVLASASLDKTVRLWPFFESRPAAADEDWQVLHHSEPVVWVSFVPVDDAPRPDAADATRFQILSISESRTQHHWRWWHQWEAVSYNMHMEPFSPAPGVVAAIAAAQDGQWIAIGIWSAETKSAQLELGRRIVLQRDVTFHIPPDDCILLHDHAAVDNISFLGSSDDEGAILAVSTDKSITFYGRDFGGRYLSQILKIPKGRELSYPISPVVLTSNSHYLSLFHHHSQEIEFWDSANLRSLYDIQCHVDYARFSSISPDGKYAVSVAEDTSPAASSIMMWSVRKARPALVIKAGKRESDVAIHAVGFSADSELIGVLTYSCDLHVWRVKTGEYMGMVQCQNDHQINPRTEMVACAACAVLAPDLMGFACPFAYEVQEAGRNITHHGISLRYRTNTDWTFGAGIPHATVPFDLARDKPHVPVGGLAFSHDGRFLAEISIDGVVTIWKTTSGRSRIQTKIRTTVGTKADDAGGEVWNYLSTSEGDNEGPSAGVAFSQYDTKLAVYFNNTQGLQLWSLEDDKPALIIRQTTSILKGNLNGHLAGLESCPAPFISPDFTRYVIYSGVSGEVTLMSLRSKQVIQVLKCHRHHRELPRRTPLVSFSPDSRRLITAFPYNGPTMKVWDAKTGAKLTEFDVSSVDGVFFWPDSRRVATTSFREGRIRVFDAKTGECCRIFQGKGQDYVVEEEKEEDT